MITAPEAIAAAIDPRRPGYNGLVEREDLRSRSALARIWWDATPPIPMRLNCPSCGALHIDEGEFATKPHHTHACQSCGMVWRPAVCTTVGVRFLPGFKNAEIKP
jgi:hypothetical protein